MVLAPGGYHVRAPGFSQTRLWMNGAAQTVIRGDGLVIVQGDGAHPAAGVTSAGRLTALRIAENRWNVFVDPDAAYGVEVTEVTGWGADEIFRLCTMDDLGEVRRGFSQPDDTGRIRFESTEHTWRFALVKGDTP